MMRVFVLSGTVSKTRAIACNMFANGSYQMIQGVDTRSALLCYSSDHQGISRICSLKGPVSSDGAHRGEGDFVPWIVGSPPHADTCHSVTASVRLTRTV